MKTNDFGEEHGAPARVHGALGKFQLPWYRPKHAEEAGLQYFYRRFYTDYQQIHIHLEILWRTCNLGHLKGKMPARISQCVLLKTTPTAWGSPKICVYSSRIVWNEQSKSICCTWSMYQAQKWFHLLLTETLDKLRGAFPFCRREDWSSVRLTYLVGSVYIPDSLIPSLCPFLNTLLHHLASWFYQTHWRGTFLV